MRPFFFVLLYGLCIATVQNQYTVFLTLGNTKMTDNAPEKYKLHMLKRFERWGGTVTTTLCGRNSEVAIDTDDENVVDDAAKVTCKFCLRRLAAAKAVQP